MRATCSVVSFSMGLALLTQMAIGGV